MKSARGPVLPREDRAPRTSASLSGASSADARSGRSAGRRRPGGCPGGCCRCPCRGRRRRAGRTSAGRAVGVRWAWWRRSACCDGTSCSWKARAARPVFSPYTPSTRPLSILGVEVDFLAGCAGPAGPGSIAPRCAPRACSRPVAPCPGSYARFLPGVGADDAIRRKPVPPGGATLPGDADDGPGTAARPGRRARVSDPGRRPAPVLHRRLSGPAVGVTACAVRPRQRFDAAVARHDRRSG